jgi:hypothetical protein
MDKIHCDHFISLLTMIFHLRACGLVSSGEDDKRQAMLTNYNKTLLKIARTISIKFSCQYQSIESALGHPKDWLQAQHCIGSVVTDNILPQ